MYPNNFQRPGPPYPYSRTPYNPERRTTVPYVPVRVVPQSGPLLVFPFLSLQTRSPYNSPLISNTPIPIWSTNTPHLPTIPGTDHSAYRMSLLTKHARLRTWYLDLLSQHKELNVIYAAKLNPGLHHTTFHLPGTMRTAGLVEFLEDRATELEWGLDRINDIANKVQAVGGELRECEGLLEGLLQLEKAERENGEKYAGDCAWN